jgi:hypothetical protein
LKAQTRADDDGSERPRGPQQEHAELGQRARRRAHRQNRADHLGVCVVVVSVVVTMGMLVLHRFVRMDVAMLLGRMKVDAAREQARMGAAYRRSSSGGS